MTQSNDRFQHLRRLLDQVQVELSAAHPRPELVPLPQLDGMVGALERRLLHYAYEQHGPLTISGLRDVIDRVERQASAVSGESSPIHKLLERMDEVARETLAHPAAQNGEDTMTDTTANSAGTSEHVITVPVLAEILARALARLSTRNAEVITFDDFADVTFLSSALAPAHPLNGPACVALSDLMRGVRASAKQGGKNTLTIDSVADLLSLADVDVTGAGEHELKVLQQRDLLPRNPDARAVMDRVHGIYARDSIACEPEQLGEVVAMVRDRFEMPELAEELRVIGENHYSTLV